MTPEQNKQHVVVVGGGLAGLASAWRLQQRGISYSLIEPGDRWGGNLYTESVSIGDNGVTVLVEHGADGFSTRDPSLLDLIREAGLADDLVPIATLPRPWYVLVNGRTLPMPDGMNGLVPTKLGSFLMSPLFGIGAKLRILREPYTPPRQDNSDESVADFVRRRFGRQALDRLGEPLLAGVYGADATKQSILATHPQLPQLEREHGSVIRGTNRQLQAQATTTGNQTAAAMSYQGGMGALMTALAAKLTGECRLHTTVTTLDATDDNYSVTLAGGETLHATGVIVTSRADTTATLLAEVAPAAVDDLRATRYTAGGSMTLAYRKGDVPFRMDAFGVLVPRRERRLIDRVTWLSAKWPVLAPNETAVIQVHFGGSVSGLLDKTDNELIILLRTELQHLFGLVETPLLTRILRQEMAYPQYAVGHLDRVAAIKRGLPSGLAVAGDVYGGAGLSNVVRSADEAVKRVTDV